MNHLPARAATPDIGGKDFFDGLNPNILKVVTASWEPSLATAKADDKFQFEPRGYFVADSVDRLPAKPVFSLAAGFKDGGSDPQVPLKDATSIEF